MLPLLQAILPVPLPPQKCQWQTIADCAVVPRMMRTHFCVDGVDAVHCEVFLIDGVPAAAMLYEHLDERGWPGEIRAFHMNKGLLMMFDAGPMMRTRLHERYGALDVNENATNRADFFVI